MRSLVFIGVLLTTSCYIAVSQIDTLLQVSEKVLLKGDFINVVDRSCGSECAQTSFKFYHTRPNKKKIAYLGDITYFEISQKLVDYYSKTKSDESLSGEEKNIKILLEMADMYGYHEPKGIMAYPPLPEPLLLWYKYFFFDQRLIKQDKPSFIRTPFGWKINTHKKTRYYKHWYRFIWIDTIIYKIHLYSIDGCLKNKVQPMLKKVSPAFEQFVQGIIIRDEEEEAQLWAVIRWLLGTEKREE